MADRTVAKIVTGQATADGAGVRLTRLIGAPPLEHLDPFLLLDEFKSDRADDYIGGFPDHPHRGFETVTYMLAGSMEHRDHVGNRGELVAGSVQWMTAGRGIVHSEMPRQKDGLLWGFQLWVNLPASDKMTAPRYQDIAPTRIPEVTLGDGVQARVIAGEAGGMRGPIDGIATAPTYLDVRVAPGARVSLDIPAGHSAFAYVYEGKAMVAGQDLGRGQLAVLGDGDRVGAAAGEPGARVIVVAGRPLREPIARYGPFVMNTRAEIVQAVEDFQRGTFG